MHDRGYELRRTPLLRGSLNKVALKRDAVKAQSASSFEPGGAQRSTLHLANLTCELQAAACFRLSIVGAPLLPGAQSPPEPPPEEPCLTVTVPSIPCCL